MGGNAFEHLKRLNAADYKIYAQEVKNRLTPHFKKIREIPYYHQKPDFGDLDLLIEKPRPERRELEKLLIEGFALQTQDIFWNKDIVSFKYENFQTDLIFVAPEHFATAQFYFAYNDLNNLVGRIAHKFGVKFGWDGLTYQIRTESGHRAQKLQLSTQPAEIYAFLGYDYQRWQKGFENLAEIFEFVCTTPYFNPEIFAYEALNHQNRTRNKKRFTYQEFLTWLDQQSFKAYRFEEDKSVYLIRLHNAFPQADLLGQLKAYAQEQAGFEAQREKFNGERVMAWTGLNGQDLGLSIAGFRKHIQTQTQESFEAWLEPRSAEEIEQSFRNWFSSVTTP
ncbi:hypothetical protein COW36_19005 [bacterium (Candidatus Blackallbacteria) CG17_big_fil_post_rev_8_21_14_2_50_48_46]|uniref:Nucleotidyltransferase n=1 Tax=bacterium (Candidatus Blackallbacteria) CG17_big_fil_post_rev_8_21_14_2_50_48_46 TaxID=2014261 RepID=A0A2M7G003_9BACT|nr:MAG: hypothetical protein COW64_25465 [bacterium (Candidatus Blackallbacteria) CG18_big_fil_WC_8_21_14_2_50_49_26]PIW15016.1 MAG: hypothetical protein COW36_19005 [bacterium (Candidatus Blackallbacteria) CG17_big_fil_post_rev_8_21_14_2_50_48_46]PIW44833.1 MAG: hypothetical protein COW20_22635 [bacterium (Candidatus Blackallbacteria) CG13_big_fil_rev_8_21_14_2_50_49_14]